jgi:hypothetical protein
LAGFKLAEEAVEGSDCWLDLLETLEIFEQLGRLNTSQRVEPCCTQLIFEKIKNRTKKEIFIWDWYPFDTTSQILSNNKQMCLLKHRNLFYKTNIERRNHV